jgi:hypothetical protein
MSSVNQTLPNILFLTTRDEAFRPSSKRSWSRDVKNFYGRRCFLSGKVESKFSKLESHHLYVSQKYPKICYSLLNGIVLERNLHVEFHRLYGYETTPEHFLLFIEYLSQQNRLNTSTNKIILVSWIKLLNQKLIEGGLEQC